jgi:hypothetical protein
VKLPERLPPCLSWAVPRRGSDSALSVSSAQGDVSWSGLVDAGCWRPVGAGFK